MNLKFRLSVCFALFITPAMLFCEEESPNVLNYRKDELLKKHEQKFQDSLISSVSFLDYNVPVFVGDSVESNDDDRFYLLSEDKGLKIRFIEAVIPSHEDLSHAGYKCLFNSDYVMLDFEDAVNAIRGASGPDPQAELYQRLLKQFPQVQIFEKERLVIARTHHGKNWIACHWPQSKPNNSGENDLAIVCLINNRLGDFDLALCRLLISFEGSEWRTLVTGQN